MLFTRTLLERIARGEVTLAFRRWRRPTVRPGGTLRTAVGLLDILAVEPVEEGAITDEEARQAGAPTRAVLLAGLAGTGAVSRIRLRYRGADPRIALRSDDSLSLDDVATLHATLSGLDRRWSDAGAHWLLEAIAAAPGLAAARMAESAAIETAVLKRRVRRLKELGLTESLEVGYRLSPRGAAYRAAVARYSASSAR